MIMLHMEFPAHALKRNISVKALIPVDSEIDWKNTTVDAGKKFRTLYLLHGFGGDCSDWLLNSRLYTYAAQHGIAVIMPSGENRFYLNNKNSEEDYSGFIGKELIEITRALFPLSDKREDTIIGGLSMGGFGAIYNGLTYPEVFGAIIAMSSALVTDKVSEMQEGYSDFMAGYSYYRYVFGNPAAVKGSETDPEALLEKSVKDKIRIPNLFLACGRDDFVLEANRSFVNKLKELGVPYTYEEDDGNHDWDFWDIHIRHALDWLEQK